MSELELLWSYVKTHPNENTPKLGLADKCEENGDFITAYALRWCVKNRRWPNTRLIRYNNAVLCYFVKNRQGLNFNSQGNSLPNHLFDSWELKKAKLEDVIHGLGTILEKRKKELEV